VYPFSRGFKGIKGKDKTRGLQRVNGITDVVIFPREIRSTIDRFVEDLVNQSTVMSAGLFGSWARYEASASSDLDMLVVDSSDMDFEFHELVEYEGLLMDVNRVPWRWVGEMVVPEMDHRLHEVLILHDPSGLLKRARGFVEGRYRTKGRVEVRTEGYLTNADMFLSRASSAMTRKDLETASLFADMSLEAVVEVLMDVAGLPITRGAFMWNLRRACERLEMMEVYKKVISLARLSGLEKGRVAVSLNRFEGVWRQMSAYIEDNGDVVEGMHDRLRRDIGYLTDPALLRCILARTGEMLERYNFVEAAMYMRGWLLPLLEDYAWVISAKRGDKFDHTSLFKTIKEHEGAEEICGGAAEVFDLRDLGRDGVRLAMDGVRSVIADVRMARRGLIEGFVG
jgi:predicted nucleotidyltransferase